MGIRDTVETGATVALAACAIMVTGLLVRQQFFVAPRGSAPVITHEPDWRKFAVGDMRFGSANAVVTVVEFDDFQCPYCEHLFRSLEAIRARYPGKVAIVYRNFPLPELHPYAMRAALTAQCAADQGRFERAYEFLFGNQDSVGRLTPLQLARRIGVGNLSRFRACVTGEAVRRRLAADSLAAQSLHIGGTPLFLVNEWLFHGMPPDSTLTATVEAELKSGGT